MPKLPEKGQWKIYHGRGHAWKPPIEFITVDFTAKTGTVQLGTQTAPLTNITVTAPDKFTAEWSLGGKSGKIEAESIDTRTAQNSLRLELPYEKGGTVVCEFNPISPSEVPVATKEEQPCCGPDVTRPLIGVLKTVVEDYKGLDAPGQDPVIRRQGHHLQIQGMGLWDIDPLRDKLSRIVPTGCACPNSVCDATVMVYDVCEVAGIVNYVLYGVIEALVLGVRLEGDVYHGLYWFGKNLAKGVVNMAQLRSPGFINAVDYGAREHFWVTVGRAYVDGGEAAMKKLVQSKPGLPCRKCPYPPKAYPWAYTWYPLFPNQRSRYP